MDEDFLSEFFILPFKKIREILALLGAEGKMSSRYDEVLVFNHCVKTTDAEQPYWVIIFLIYFTFREVKMTFSYTG